MRLVMYLVFFLCAALVAGAVFFMLYSPMGSHPVNRLFPAGFLLLLAIVFLIVGLMVRGSGLVGHARLQQTGIPARASIVGVADTRLSMNQLPVIEFTLDVLHPDGSTRRHTTRHPVQRPALGTFRPGMSLGVRIDPKRPDNIVIDPDAPGGGADRPGDAPSPASRTGNAGSPRPAGVAHASDIVRAGIHTSATVVQAIPTGLTAGLLSPDADPSIASHPVVILELAVSAPDRSTFTARGSHRIPPEHLGRVFAGATLPVAYLPRDPTQLTAIDWDRKS